jgi:hypothetical protein
MEALPAKHAGRRLQNLLAAVFMKLVVSLARHV